MSSIILFIIVVGIIACLFLFINLAFAPHNPYQEKYTMFECGYHSFHQTRLQFNVTFFIFALVFLVFDLELLLMFPYAVSDCINDIYGSISALLFLFIILIGFIFELGKGALNIYSKQELTLLNFVDLNNKTRPIGGITKIDIFVKRYYSNWLWSSPFKPHRFVNFPLQCKFKIVNFSENLKSLVTPLSQIGHQKWFNIISYIVIIFSTIGWILAMLWDWNFLSYLLGYLIAIFSLIVPIFSLINNIYKYRYILDNKLSYSDKNKIKDLPLNKRFQKFCMMSIGLNLGTFVMYYISQLQVFPYSLFLFFLIIFLIWLCFDICYFKKYLIICNKIQNYSRQIFLNKRSFILSLICLAISYMLLKIFYLNIIVSIIDIFNKDIALFMKDYLSINLWMALFGISFMDIIDTNDYIKFPVEEIKSSFKKWDRSFKVKLESKLFPPYLLELYAAYSPVEPDRAQYKLGEGSSTNKPVPYGRFTFPYRLGEGSGINQPVADGQITLTYCNEGLQPFEVYAHGEFLISAVVLQHGEIQMVNLPRGQIRPFGLTYIIHRGLLLEDGKVIMVTRTLPSGNKVIQPWPVPGQDWPTTSEIWVLYPDSSKIERELLHKAVADGKFQFLAQGRPVAQPTSRHWSLVQPHRTAGQLSYFHIQLINKTVSQAQNALIKMKWLSDVTQDIIQSSLQNDHQARFILHGHLNNEILYIIGELEVKTNKLKVQLNSRASMTDVNKTVKEIEKMTNRALAVHGNMVKFHDFHVHPHVHR